jgi:hypothetical protein
MNIRKEAGCVGVGKKELKRKKEKGRSKREKKGDGVPTYLMTQDHVTFT